MTQKRGIFHRCLEFSNNWWFSPFFPGEVRIDAKEIRLKITLKFISSVNHYDLTTQSQKLCLHAEMKNSLFRSPYLEVLK